MTSEQLSRIAIQRRQMVRRWFAVVSFICGAILYPVALFLAPGEVAERMDSFSPAYYAFIGAIISIYIGAGVIDSMKS